MKPTVTYEEILKETTYKKIVFVDVRSPKEFEQATIPGAVNIPVLDNEARATIGTLYVNGQVDEAKKMGIEWGANHLPEMYDQYREVLKDCDEVAIFCSRGGMRSNTIFSLLKAIGMPVSRIKGGYKAYRQYVAAHLDEQLRKVDFVTLYGFSGCGKTDILKELSRQGFKTLDLEGCANHRGSILGSVGLTAAHSQKMFESLLFDVSRNWQVGDVIFTEGESRRIGRVLMPPTLYDAIQEGQKVLIEAEMATRVTQISHDYMDQADLEELTESLEMMKKVLSSQRVLGLQAELKAGNGDQVIETLLHSYYDPKYKSHQKDYVARFQHKEVQETAGAIISWFQENNK